MKKRIWLRLGLVGLLGLAAFIAYLWLTMPSHRIDRASFEQIAEGMTQAEVEAILRAPPGKHCASTAQVEMKRHDGSSGGIFVNEIWDIVEEHQRELQADQRRAAVWAGDRGMIIVTFDAADRVVEKHFHDMYNEGLVTRARNWLAAIF